MHMLEPKMISNAMIMFIRYNLLASPTVKKFTSTFSWIQVGRGSVHLEVRQGVEREKGWGQDPVQRCARRHLQGGNFKAKKAVVLLFVFISLWQASLDRVRVWETSWWSVFNPTRASIARWDQVDKHILSVFVTLCLCFCDGNLHQSTKASIAREHVFRWWRRVLGCHSVCKRLSWTWPTSPDISEWSLL